MRTQADTPTYAADLGLVAGEKVGPYSLLRVLGEGGMGEVWEAEQREPIRRRVALKVLKVGLDTRAFIARFESERQALAVMDHPNIARALDAGATASGRPYYVMELVPGTPITTFCDDNRLSTRERLQLFCSVCRAVHHAHQKAVIHRDLKPSNVLVIRQDDTPTAKVIDFGIAKALTGHLTDKTYATEVGQAVGTPAYMSPEQWGGALDLDTRTDIYSLGVMLYELLVGSLPVDPTPMRRAGAEAARLLTESSPAAPSTRARSLGTQLAELARMRRTDVRAFVGELSGDLDWITLKALEADRTRRYETAHALLQDILRHLNGEAVLARPASAWYRASRFARRHRVGTAVALAAVAAGAAFTSMTLVQSRRVAAERDRARLEADRASALNAFLERTLLAPDPYDGLGRGTTMLEVLDSAAARLTREPPRLPAVDASVRSAIGWAYFKLSIHDRAEPLLRQALTTRVAIGDSANLGESLVRVAALHAAAARYDSALQKFAEGIETMRRTATPPHVRADALLRFATFLGDRGDTAAARRALAEAREIYSVSGDSAGFAAIEVRLGLMEYFVGQRDSAAARFRAAADYRRRFLGAHPLLAEALSNLAAVLEDVGRTEEAEAAYREALDISRRTLGATSEQTTATINNLALLLGNMGRVTEAEPLFREALAADEARFGAAHPAVAGDLINLGRMLCRSDAAARGEEPARRARAIFARTLGDTAWQVAQASVILGTCLTALGRLPAAEAALTEGIRGLERSLGPAHWRVDSARARLGAVRARAGRPASGQR